MTEPIPNDQAERIRRLQERRAASGRARPAASEGATPAAVARTANPARTRRRHPAAATRIVLAGLSVSSFFSIAGAIALSHRSASTTQSGATAGAVNTVTGATAAGAQPGVATNAVAHTVTKAS